MEVRKRGGGVGGVEEKQKGKLSPVTSREEQ